MIRMNKRFTVFILSAVTASGMALSGCGQKAASEDVQKNAESSAAEDSSEISETEAVSGEAETESAETEAVSGETQAASDEAASKDKDADETVKAEAEPAVEIDGLEYIGSTELDYAQCFTIDNYEGGYSLIDIPESGRYLVVPEDEEAPENLDEDIIILKQPLDNIYLAATSAMSLFAAVDSLDNIRMSGIRESGWYIDAPAEAMQNGDIIYAGNYSEPDYETMIEEDCDLAVESTMIYHTPKVKEMIEDLDIPVLVDRSSYEDHPLGRTEWIKMYAVLTGKQEEAEKFFDEESRIIEELERVGNTGKKVAFFYINTDGSAVVRGSSDYIPKMIELAGAQYNFEQIEGASASIPITMEDFYASAVDADYLIYNGSIDTSVKSIDDLIKKNELFKDFKAVKNGNVWNTGKSFYQSTDIVGRMIKDINIMITDGSPDEMTFLSKM